MKPKTFITFQPFFIIGYVLLIWLCVVGNIIGNGGKFKINNERMGVMFVKPYYRAYWIRYSNGLKYPYRTFRDNLWCVPKYESVNMKDFMVVE